MNQKIKNNTRNNIFRATLLAIAFLAVGIFTAQIKAQTVQTSIQMSDQMDEIIGGRVTVFNAGSGRQIANGLAFRDDHGEFKFVFTSPINENIVFVVLTDNGYFGFNRGTTGHINYAFGSLPISQMPFVHANRNGDANLTFTDENGTPLRKAVVTTVEWSSLGNARRGKTNQQGQYLFKDPRDLAGSDFLAVAWNGYGENITVQAILSGSHNVPGEVDYLPPVE